MILNFIGDSGYPLVPILVCPGVDAYSLSLRTPANHTVIFSKVLAATKVKAAIIVVFTSSGRAARYCYLFMHAYYPC